jgi:hypothetical protein
VKLKLPISHPRLFFLLCLIILKLPFTFLEKGIKLVPFVPGRVLATSHLLNLKSIWHFKKHLHLSFSEELFLNVFLHPQKSLPEQKFSFHFIGKSKGNCHLISSPLNSLTSQFLVLLIYLRDIPFQGILTPSLPF